MAAKIFKQILRNKLITGTVLILIVTAGYIGYQGLVKDKDTVQYVTAAAEKGTLIVSVSGTGQVIVLDQVDIKPKVSGDIEALYISKDKEVKAGQLLAVLDSRETQKAIRDAQAALDSAKVKLEELLLEPDAKSLLQAENALAQSERDLDKAKENYEEINIDAQRSLATAYEEGYGDVSTIFFRLSDYMKDLKEVLGTEQITQEYISAYKLILSSESLFIQKLLDDYYRADNLFNKNFTFFRKVYREDDRDVVYKLIGDTLETAKAISQTLESARHMFDAIKVRDYKHFYIASHIDKMQPKIESDISSVYSNISSLQRIKDTIDDTNQNTPKKIKDAELAIKSAQEKLEEKELALQELMAGANAQDIKSQQNIVTQKEDALLDAKEKLAEHFIRAPFDGLIAEVSSKIKKGDSVSAGTVLATLITQQKIAEITLNEVDVAKVKVGQKATITFDAIENLTITGEVIEVDTLGTISQGVVTYNIKIAFDAQDERVKPGMSLSAQVITNLKQGALLVPNSAIKQQANMPYVQVVDGAIPEPEMATADISSSIVPGSSLRTQSIQIGLSNDTMTEVLDGLKEGDRVVTQTISSNSNQSQPQPQQNTGFGLPGIMPSGGTQMREMRQIIR